MDWSVCIPLVDNNSASCGSRSPYLGEMWREACPESPDWDGDVELSSARVEEEDDGRVTLTGTATWRWAPRKWKRRMVVRA